MLSKIRIFLLGTFVHDWLDQISSSWWVLKSSGHELFKTHLGSSIWAIGSWVIWVQRKVVFSDPAQSWLDYPWLSPTWPGLERVKMNAFFLISGPPTNLFLTLKCKLSFSHFKAAKKCQKSMCNIQIVLGGENIERCPGVHSMIVCHFSHAHNWFVHQPILIFE